MSRLILGTFFLLVLSGCATALQPQQDRLLQQNRYGDLRALMEPKIAGNADATTNELIYLCMAYSKTRAYDRLFPCLDRLQARIDARDKHWYWFDMSAAPALLRAQAQLELGDIDSAVANAENGYRLSHDVSKYMRIMGRSVLSLVFAHAGRRQDAERIAAELASIGTGYPDTFLASDKYVGLARTRMALADWAGALDALERDDAATGFFKGLTNVVTGAALTGDSLFDYVDLPKHFMRARSLMELGRTSEARQIYDELLARPTISQNADLIWIILDDRGRIAELDGDPAAAERFYRRATQAIELQRASIRAEAGRIGFVGDKQGLYRRLVNVLLKRGSAAEAFTVAEQAKSRALIDLLGSRDIAKSPRAAKVSTLVSQLENAQLSLVEMDEASVGTPTNTRSASVSAIANELRRSAPEVASLVTVSSPTIVEIQALLAANETLVEYFGGGDELVAFVITRDSITARKLDASGLQSDVATFRKQLQNPARDPQADAHRLYRRLLGPLEDVIRGPRLLIVPHGPLHYVPFSALRDMQDYLVARYAIRVLPAAGVMPFLRPAPLSDDRILLIGNPDLGTPEKALPGAEEEVQAIQTMWPRSTVLVRAQASKAALERLAGQYRRLHLATHGTFRPDAPLSSGLLLAAEGGKSGVLSVGELYGLSLDADLVTLSACETGLGSVQSGDDIIGLQRGFLFAGARNIVSSLWKVNDDATRNLMVAFYGELAKGVNKRDALREAQLAIKKEMPEPFYWAAFQLTGGQ